MNFIYLIKGQFYKQYFETRRYLLNSTFKTILRVSVLFVAIYGFNNLFFSPSNAFDLNSALVLIFLFQHASQAFSKSADSIAYETLNGSLEKIYATPTGIFKLIMARFIVSYIFLTISSIILLIVFMLILNNWISFSWPKFLISISFSVISLYGIGLILCGLSLLFKQVNDLVSFLRLPIMFLATLPPQPFNIYSCFPFSMGAYTTKQIILNNTSFPLWWYGYILANSLFYFFLGYLIFKICERRTLLHGSLGHQ